MNVYIIDDNAAKMEHLPAFIDWLDQSFPAYQYRVGFANPIQSAEDAESIRSALKDPDGIILLDLFMEGQNYENAADGLLDTDQGCTERRDQIWSKLQAAAHQPGITKLAATIAALAEHYGARLAWISSDERVNKVLAQYVHLTNPKLPWEGTWGEDQRADLEPLIDNFRKPYLNATKAWNEMHSKLHKYTFSFPGQPKAINKLFPDDGQLGHNPSEHVANPKIFAANEAAVAAIVTDFASALSIPLPQSAMDSVRNLYFLKFASRSQELHLEMLHWLFEPNVSLTGVHREDGLVYNGGSPGALILALHQVLSQPPVPRIFFEKTNDGIVMRLVFQAYPNCSQEEQLKTLQMCPGQRMKERGGPHPGTANLALDYIRPDAYAPSEAGAMVTKHFRKDYAQ